MRMVPLMYASNDDKGDPLDREKATYLFCGKKEESIDMFGLNVERWCDPHDNVAYDSIDEWVGRAKFPGAFLFSEMGCSATGQGYHGARDWKQVPDFFNKFKHIDGFSAYAFWNIGATEFNMFDGGTDSAQMYLDGFNFFEQLTQVGTDRSQEAGSSSNPKCSSTLGGAKIEPMPTSYDDDLFPQSDCPKPLKSMADEI